MSVDRRTWAIRFGVAALAMVVLGELGARVALARSDAPVLRWHDFSTQLKVEQMDERGDVDLVVIGTSMAQQDIVPGVLADALADDGGPTETIYNAALNGGVPVVMEPWLLDQVVPRLRPDVVVWGLSPLDMSLEYGDATLEAYEDALQTRPGILAEVDRFVSRFSDLVAARAVLRNPDQILGSGRDDNRRRLAEAEAEVGPDGERTNFASATGIGHAQEMARRITPFQLDRDDLAAIARTVDALRRDGIEVVFVELPVPDRFRRLYPGGPEQQQLVTDTIAALGEALDVEVITSIGPTDDSSFVDFTHLGPDAAVDFTRLLAEPLARS